MLVKQLVQGAQGGTVSVESSTAAWATFRVVVLPAVDPVVAAGASGRSCPAAEPNDGNGYRIAGYVGTSSGDMSTACATTTLIVLWGDGLRESQGLGFASRAALPLQPFSKPCLAPEWHQLVIAVDNVAV